VYSVTPMIRISPTEMYSISGVVSENTISSSEKDTILSKVFITRFFVVK
jgi:hypothetical protein